MKRGTFKQLALAALQPKGDGPPPAPRVEHLWSQGVPIYDSIDGFVCKGCGARVTGEPSGVNWEDLDMHRLPIDCDEAKLVVIHEEYGPIWNPSDAWSEEDSAKAPNWTDMFPGTSRETKSLDAVSPEPPVLKSKLIIQSFKDESSQVKVQVTSLDESIEAALKPQELTLEDRVRREISKQGWSENFSSPETDASIPKNIQFKCGRCSRNGRTSRAFCFSQTPLPQQGWDSNPKKGTTKFLFEGRCLQCCKTFKGKLVEYSLGKRMLWKQFCDKTVGRVMDS